MWGVWGVSLLLCDLPHVVPREPSQPSSAQGHGKNGAVLLRLNSPGDQTGRSFATNTRPSPLERPAGRSGTPHAEVQFSNAWVHFPLVLFCLCLCYALVNTPTTRMEICTWRSAIADLNPPAPGASSGALGEGTPGALGRSSWNGANSVYNRIFARSRTPKCATLVLGASAVHVRSRLCSHFFGVGTQKNEKRAIFVKRVRTANSRVR